MYSMFSLTLPLLSENALFRNPSIIFIVTSLCFVTVLMPSLFGVVFIFYSLVLTIYASNDKFDPAFKHFENTANSSDNKINENMSKSDASRRLRLDRPNLEGVEEVRAKLLPIVKTLFEQTDATEIDIDEDNSFKVFSRLGDNHMRLNQYYKKMRVYATQTIARKDRDGSIDYGKWFCRKRFKS